MNRCSMIFVFVMLMVAGGCNIIGFVADKADPGTTDAQFVPPKWTMVVIAENWRNHAGSAIDSQQLAEFVYDDLRKHDVAPQIDPSAVTELQSKRSDFGSMTIAQIGKTLGAQQVLYINVTESSMTSPIGSDSLAGKCTARVKIVDVDTGEATWPRDEMDGYPVTVKTPLLEAHSDSDDAALRRALQEKVAASIARLFYKAPTEE